MKSLNCGELYFHVVRFAIMFKVVLAFESVDEMIQCVHSNELLNSTFTWHWLPCCTRWF